MDVIIIFYFYTNSMSLECFSHGFIKKQNKQTRYEYVCASFLGESRWCGRTLCGFPAFCFGALDSVDGKVFAERIARQPGEACETAYMQYTHKFCTGKTGSLSHYGSFISSRIYFHTTELDKTMEIKFSNLFYNVSKMLPNFLSAFFVIADISHCFCR